jgi:hypothetical protein
MRWRMIRSREAHAGAAAEGSGAQTGAYHRGANRYARGIARWRRLVSQACRWGALLGLVLCSMSSGARAGDTAGDPDEISVLWYTYADPTSRYRTMIRRLAEAVQALPQAGGKRWRLTFFDPTSPRPAFQRFSVLVIQSGEAFQTGWSAQNINMIPDFSGILRNRAHIEAARGERTFLTGADADVHAINGDTGNAPTRAGYRVKCDPPLTAPSCWDGATGHLVNAINWAGSGRGLGIVSFVAAEFPNSRWWLQRDSFLREELAGVGFVPILVDIYGPGRRENEARIPGFAVHSPLNRGLTSKGLSHWNSSFHAGFSHAIPGYVRVVDSVRYPGVAVAIASGASLPAGAAATPFTPRRFGSSDWKAWQAIAGDVCSAGQIMNAMR